MSQPWVDLATWGDSANPLGGRRLLVIGESYYTGEVGTPSEDHNSYVVRKYAVEQYDNFFGRLTQMLSRKRWSDHNGEELGALWSAIAFYNYVPLSVGGQGDRPSEPMWKLGAEALQPVLASIGPEAVLVCGDETWRHLWDDWRGEPPELEIHRPGGDGAEDIWTRKAGGATFRYMKHPSGSFGFSTARWQPAVDHLLQRA